MYFSCQDSPSLVIMIERLVRLWVKYLTGVACGSVEAVFAGDPASHQNVQEDVLMIF